METEHVQLCADAILITPGRCRRIAARLPAALAPLRQVRALGAEGGVLAVAGIEPGAVRVNTEQALLDVVEPGDEIFRAAERVTYSAWKQAVPGEGVDAAVRAGQHQGDRARSVPPQMHH